MGDRQAAALNGVNLLYIGLISDFVLSKGMFSDDLFQKVKTRVDLLWYTRSQ